MDRIEARILEIIEKNSEILKTYARNLYLHAERGFCEVNTARNAADFLKKLELPVREGLAVTGVRAELSGDGPHIAVIGELDGILSPAHPQAAGGYAHACGHHCQMTALLGAALALTDPQVREALDGAVTFFCCSGGGIYTGRR